jgi:hypothetical protein
MYKQNIQVQLDAEKPPETKKTLGKPQEPILPDEPSSDSNDQNVNVQIEE